MFRTRLPAPVVFFHIPKTGGVTVHSLLRKKLPARRICPERFNRLQRLSPAQIEQYDLFSGHYDAASISRLPSNSRVISVLREPRARILSLYYHWKSHRPEIAEQNDLAGPRLAHRYGLLEFLRCPEPVIAFNIDNVQVRSMIGRIWVGKNRQFRVDEQVALHQAQEYLESLFDFGITEDLDSFVARLFPRLGFRPPKQVPYRNSHREFKRDKTMQVVEREPITDEIEAELDRLTHWDRELYNFARDLLAEREAAAKRRSA